MQPGHYGIPCIPGPVGTEEPTVFFDTQNTDGLEIDAGVPPETVLAAHGSWKTQRCWGCKTPYPDKPRLERGAVFETASWWVNMYPGC